MGRLSIQVPSAGFPATTLEGHNVQRRREASAQSEASCVLRRVRAAVLAAALVQFTDIAKRT